MVYRKYLVILLSMILVFGLGCVDNISPKSRTDKEKTLTTGTITTTAIQTPINKVLIEHHAKSIDKLTKHIWPDGPEYQYPRPGMTFLVMNLKITNQGYPSVKINKYSWYLKVNTKDNPNAYVEADKIFYGEQDGIECKETELENEGWALCKIVFEVPRNHDRYKITWGDYSNKNVEWKYMPN